MPVAGTILRSARPATQTLRPCPSNFEPGAARHSLARSLPTRPSGSRLHFGGKILHPTSCAPCAFRLRGEDRRVEGGVERRQWAASSTWQSTSGGWVIKCDWEIFG